MTSSHPTPEFVYRLATATEWFAAQEVGVVPTRDIDKRDGYIHLSTREQVIETANLHFADAEDLLALEIPFAGISDQAKFELAPNRGELFPHLYGALTAAHVASAIRLNKTEAGFQFGDSL